MAEHKLERKDIEKLALLSRLSLKDSDIEPLRNDIENILGYISEIKNAPVGPNLKDKGELRNVMRSDENPHESGVFQEGVVGQFPSSDKGYLKVKKILPQ